MLSSGDGVVEDMTVGPEVGEGAETSDGAGVETSDGVGLSVVKTVGAEVRDGDKLMVMVSSVGEGVSEIGFMDGTIAGKVVGPGDTFAIWPQKRSNKSEPRLEWKASSLLVP